MTVYELLDHIKKKLQEQEQFIAQSMGDGNCSTLEEYRYYCGQIQGLRSAIDIMKTTMRNIEERE